MTTTGSTYTRPFPWLKTLAVDVIYINCAKGRTLSDMTRSTCVSQSLVRAGNSPRMTMDETVDVPRKIDTLALENNFLLQ